MSDRRVTSISKALSKLLRHQAANEGLSIDEHGFVPLEQVLTHQYLKSKKAIPEDVFKAVANNDKKRFKIVEVGSEDEDPVTTYDATKKYKICALQGHSIKTVTDSYEMEPVDELPSQIIHGTFLNKLDAIIESGGLSKMNRNHIHLTDGIGISGIRKNATALIYLDTVKLKNSPIKFLRSGNGVILTEGINGMIPKEYFLRITRRDGTVITDLL